MLLLKESEVAGSVYRKEFLARLVPKTGIVVRAAVTPARCAAPPARRSGSRCWCSRCAHLGC